MHQLLPEILELEMPEIRAGPTCKTHVLALDCIPPIHNEVESREFTYPCAIKPDYLERAQGPVGEHLLGMLDTPGPTSPVK